MYFKKGKAKIELAIAKGKKQFDKRASKKNRDWNRDKARYVRKKQAKFVYLGIGSNLGNRKSNIENAKIMLSDENVKLFKYQIIMKLHLGQILIILNFII